MSKLEGCPYSDRTGCRWPQSIPSSSPSWAQRVLQVTLSLCVLPPSRDVSGQAHRRVEHDSVSEINFF
jgi:hypothetical protein